MAYLEREGIRLHYERREGPNGKLPVLLTHGFGSSSGMWEPNLAALSSVRQVITWDMRGHGDSDSPSDPGAYNQQACLEDMAAILDEAGAERAVLGGLSLGGYLSLDFCLAYPGRVTALILCDTGPGFRKDEARQQWNDRAHAQASRLESEGLTALGSADAGRHVSAAGVAHAARGMLTQRDAHVMEGLPRIAVPTLVLVGSRDKPFLGAAGYLTAKIPGAVQVIIEDAGHVSNLDQPEQFDREVLAFLGGLP